MVVLGIDSGNRDNGRNKEDFMVMMVIRVSSGTVMGIYSGDRDFKWLQQGRFHDDGGDSSNKW